MEESNGSEVGDEEPERNNVVLARCSKRLESQRMNARSRKLKEILGMFKVRALSVIAKLNPTQAACLQLMWTTWMW